MCEDKDLLNLLRRVKNVLVCIATSDHESAHTAAVYLHDGEGIFTMADLECLGSEMLRRLTKHSAVAD